MQIVKDVPCHIEPKEKHHLFSFGFLTRSSLNVPPVTVVTSFSDKPPHQRALGQS